MSLTKTQGDGIGGEGVVFQPRDKAYKNVVIFLHGLGDTADGWASVMPTFNLSQTKFILPTASVRPITLNGGFPMPAWSDISSISNGSAEDKEGFEQSSLRIKSIVDNEKLKGILTNNIVVGGFSQGGAVSLHFCMRSENVLGGCIAMSSWLPFANEYPEVLGKGIREGTPILQCHGLLDSVVQYDWGKSSHEKIKSMSPSAKFETFSNLDHSACPEEIEKVNAFLKSCLNEN
eukprot:CAMPEP_0171473450 /NCGR_PEP_ID=MMETSP0946-20130122/1847_1 /TAXON_ID=109269 /ORGANISM="Vaucheria litorea, Strain CCMP2940" /LENGTH=232 /DNA_ID=CAMNT_0012003213 /DNA_START=49 /DNA_END=747 /DNA_ORIENTATION=-